MSNILAFRDGLAVVEDLCTPAVPAAVRTAVRACKRPYVPENQPGPCPKASRRLKSLRRKAAVVRKRSAPRKAAVQSQPGPARAMADYSRRVARLTRAYEGGIKEQKQLSGGKMGETYEVTFNNGTKGILKIAKLNREFPMLTPDKQTHHEFLAPQIGAAAGISTMPAAIRLAPDTVLKEYGEGTPAAEYDPDELAQIREQAADDLRRLGFFDVLTHNGDRHDFNWLVQRQPNGSPTIVPIDHGNMFGPVSRDEYREVSPLPEYSNPEMTNPFTRTGKSDRNGRPELEYLADGMSVKELEDAETALKTLRPAFDEADITHQYKAMLERLDKMLKDARYLEQRAKRKAAEQA